MKEIYIKLPKDNKEVASDLADIICWLNGYLEGKGDNCNSRWLIDSLITLREVKMQIQYPEDLKNL